MQISTKIKNIRTSGTVKMAQLARELKQEGKDIIELSEGEPDFNTPKFIIDAAFKAAHDGHTKYTDVRGTLELREAISKKFLQDNKIHYSSEEIIVGTGAKQIIFNALVSTLNSNDEVIIPSPYWVSYPDMVKIADGIPIIVSCSKEDHYKITPETLSKAINKNTRWLILNSPGNPTGAIYSSSDLLSLADTLRQHKNVSIICDDIYEVFTYENKSFANILEVAPDLKDRVLTVNGVSKSHAMTGWRIGYAGGPLDLIRAMTKLQGQSTTNPSSVGQAAALAALNGSKDIIKEWNMVYTKRKNLVQEKLSKINNLTFLNPEGAFYFFIDCTGLIGKSTFSGLKLKSDIDICMYLLEHAQIAIVPGSEFGMPNFLRLCFAKSDKILVEACKRIEKSICALET